MNNWRCWLGHDWSKCGHSSGFYPYECGRCGSESKECRNCGRYHDPTAIVICTVTVRHD